MVAVIGIDPGVTGAMAVVLGESIEFHDMPITVNDKGRKAVDPQAFAKFLRPLRKYQPLVVIERVQPRHDVGSIAGFSLGNSFGVVQGVAAGMRFKIHYILPRKWKEMAGTIKKEKDYTRILVIKQYPSLRHELARKKDLGRAEALMIALHGQEMTDGSKHALKRYHKTVGRPKLTKRARRVIREDRRALNPTPNQAMGGAGLLR